MTLFGLCKGGQSCLGAHQGRPSSWVVSPLRQQGTPLRAKAKEIVLSTTKYIPFQPIKDFSSQIQLTSKS